MCRRAWCVLLLLAAACGTGPDAEPKSVAELEALLRDREPAVQAQAAHELSRHGPAALSALPALVKALGSKHTAVRQNAAVALGHMGPAAREAVPPLTGALRDPEYGVRRSAADALGQIGPEARSAIPALERLSRESDPCKAGESALKKIRS